MKQILHKSFQKCQCWYEPLFHATQDPKPMLDLTAWGFLQENSAGNG
jgi:hypothetical protein